MSEIEPATAAGVDPQQTEVGSVFVSNYPPYSFWSKDEVSEAQRALDASPAPDTSLGLYLHIPFCRQRCKFCYFRVYTDKNSRDVQDYCDALLGEARLYADKRAVSGRPLRFVYVGGGTPSFISAKHLKFLFGGLQSTISWESVEEVTFECEPGTLTRPKLEVIRDIGVSRLSLGVENFNDEILQENGRAHLSKEIFRVAPWIRELAFDQFNVDLIAGMIGETWETWKDTVQQAVDMNPDSLTIYQMELPFNTVYSSRVLDGQRVPVADWKTKREWHDYAIETLSAAGYEVSSAYTMVKAGRGARFAYRDSLWHGSDLVGIGVSSFSHVNGVHYQNVARWDEYLKSLAGGTLPLDRAFRISGDERLTRETILQLKLGRLDANYFSKKFGVDILERFAQPLEALRLQGMLTVDGRSVCLTRKGLLRVDLLLPRFYAEKYQNSRYT